MRKDELYSRVAMLILGLGIGLVLGAIVGIVDLAWISMLSVPLIALSAWLDQRSIIFRDDADYG